MGFKIPEYLSRYIDAAKYRKPWENFTNNSTYYSQLNYNWINYMNTVVRPCIAYGSGASDGASTPPLSMSTGLAICRGAARLVIGDRYFFTGDDTSVKFLSDIWSPLTNFNRFLNRAVSFSVTGGTCVAKLNIDERGRCTVSAVRVDRSLVSVAENGEITDAVFFLTLFTSQKSGGNETAYWLVEERKYDDEGRKKIIYKVFAKNGIENSPTLPSPYQSGIAEHNLPPRIKAELKRMRIPRLNEEIDLPIGDGLGVWLITRTAINSTIPDAPFGDPVLYGCLDLLWSLDIVFSGSLMDVLNGEGKILVPKQFLQDTLNRLTAQYPGATFDVTTSELNTFGDDSFVYVMASGLDREKQTPTPIQFDIRADQYGKMMELYEREACVRAGFSPSSIFPYLTPDNSAKTATEITAEENLTRASVRDMHFILVPVLNRILREILRQEGLSTDAQIQLDDYIGNKMHHDQNVRENYAAGLVPLEVAIKKVNNLNDEETKDYIKKIKSEQAVDYEMMETAGEDPNTFKDGVNDEYSEDAVEYAGANT